jgi:hypothetical protein
VRKPSHFRRRCGRRGERDNLCVAEDVDVDVDEEVDVEGFRAGPVDEAV